MNYNGKPKPDYTFGCFVAVIMAVIIAIPVGIFLFYGTIAYALVALGHYLFNH